MYNFTVATYSRDLGKLKRILEKAKVWQQEKKISDETIMNARLTLDQFSLAQQVRSVTNFARQTGEVLCNIEAKKPEDSETNLSALIERIDVTVAFLSTLNETMIANDLETRLVPLYWMPGKGIVAKYFVESYAHKNFYFHYVTAYSILRHSGLSIGKGDYMVMPEFKDLA